MAKIYTVFVYVGDTEYDTCRNDIIDTTQTTSIVSPRMTVPEKVIIGNTTSWYATTNYALSLTQAPTPYWNMICDGMDFPVVGETFWDTAPGAMDGINSRNQSCTFKVSRKYTISGGAPPPVRTSFSVNYYRVSDGGATQTKLAYKNMTLQNYMQTTVFTMKINCRWEAGDLFRVGYWGYLDDTGGIE